MTTNRYYELRNGTGLANLGLHEGPVPEPGVGEVLVRLKAASLNYRDIVTLKGGYGSKQKLPLVPLSDAAGEVIAAGPGVNRFKVGDRVISTFFPDWISGEPAIEKLSTAIGGLVDGVLTQYRVFPQGALVRTPDHLSDEEAAALPTAGLTAWSAVITRGDVRPGDIVLVQGTGNVSLFASQFAKMAGARVIMTSSSDERLERAKVVGIDHGINYKTTPEWGKAARALTGDRGVDHVVEVGGAGTLKQTFRAIRVGGTVSIVGVLSGATTELLIPLIIMQSVRLQGVSVGSRENFEAMLGAMAFHGVKPVMDERIFSFGEAKEALEYLQTGKHFGKVVIRLQ